MSDDQQLGPRLGEAERGIDRLQRRIEELEQRMTADLERSRSELATMKSFVRYTVNREVTMMYHGRFALYIFHDDSAAISLRANETYSYVMDISPEAARAHIANTIAQRPGQPLDSATVLREHWSSEDISHYNAVHRALLACLKAEGRDADFIDVGANTGDTALFAADVIVRLGSKGRVHSFEPGPVFELARANVFLNGMADRIDAVHAAASDTDGYSPMTIMVGHSESGSIAGIEKHYSDIPVGETRMVRTVRLDTYFADRRDRDYYLKIDAEGHDFAVMKGATGLIEAGRVPVMHLEVVPKYMSEDDGAFLKRVCEKYALYNLRSLDAAGTFDQFEHIHADAVPDFLTKAATYHGWTDVVLIDSGVANSKSFQTLMQSRPARNAAA